SAHENPAAFAVGEQVSVENYGRVADALRRDLRVAQVICLGGAAPAPGAHPPPGQTPS
ncbi:MAG TPA: hypothetical protein PLV04_12235, partial [Phenylobacterium sp.]|nr:hypothetical protein [Phenylobacterium sp.]